MLLTRNSHAVLFDNTLPFTITPIRVPRTRTVDASARSIKNRSNTAMSIVKLIAGNTDVDFSVQTTSLIKSLDQVQREDIIKNLGTRFNIPTEHVASMKATLNMPWNQLRQISRWLKTFDIKLASEKETRNLVKEWVGDGVRAEMAPLTKLCKSGKRVEVILRPWAYMYNIVAHILKQLQNLHEHGQLVQHPFIPVDKIYLKIGGDHGDTSFKMSYQIGNLRNPNRKENTIVFSIFEAKNTRSNLRNCLARYKAQIRTLQRMQFNGKSISAFMYGDYEFLCVMYGMTGANGKLQQYLIHTTLKVLNSTGKYRNSSVNFRAIV